MSTALLEPRHVSRALIRAGVGALVAIPLSIFTGLPGAFFTAALTVGTVPLSVAELALREKPRVGFAWHAALFLASTLVVVAAAFEATYVLGIIEGQCIAGGLEWMRSLARGVTQEDGDVGRGTFVVWLAIVIGFAIPLWAPFAARQAARGQCGEMILFALAALGASIAGVVVGGILVVALGASFADDHAQMVLFFAPVALVLAAAPGSVAVPFAYTIGDAIDLLVASRHTPDA